MLLAAGLVLSLISSVIVTAAFFRDPPPELAVDWGNPVLLFWLGVFASLLLALAALPVCSSSPSPDASFGLSMATSR